MIFTKAGGGIFLSESVPVPARKFTKVEFSLKQASLKWAPDCTSMDEMRRQIAQLARDRVEVRRKIAQLARDRVEDRRKIVEDRRKIELLERNRNDDRRKIELLERNRNDDMRQLELHQQQIGDLQHDVKYLATQRAVTVATQVMYEFIGEQPRRGYPSNLFSGLRHSVLMTEMLKNVFRRFQGSRSREELLMRFDSLADKRNATAHPALDAPCTSWKIRDLLAILHREQAKARLDDLQETSLWILSNVDDIRACRAYTFGLSHHQRVEYHPQAPYAP